jgi:hypothetical protein
MNKGSAEHASINRTCDSNDPRQHAGARRGSLSVSCWCCHHDGVFSADVWQDAVYVPSFGPRMVCTRCGIVGADVRPNWTERPERPTLTGTQWC